MNLCVENLSKVLSASCSDDEKQVTSSSSIISLISHNNIYHHHHHNNNNNNIQSTSLFKKDTCENVHSELFKVRTPITIYRLFERVNSNGGYRDVTYVQHHAYYV